VCVCVCVGCVAVCDGYGTEKKCVCQ
jgi:hypothetical protein